MTSWRLPKIRRLRSEIEPFVDVLRAELPADIEWHLMGSYRRGAEVVGDLDVLMITESGELPFTGDLWTPGVELPSSVDWDRIGPRICQGSMFLADNDYVHIDIWGAKPHQRGAMLAFSTGPAQLNIVQRKRAISMGYALSQDGLFEAKTKRQLDNGTEEDIYRWLGLDYMTPEQRERWADKKPPTPKPYPPVHRKSKEMPEETTTEQPAKVTPIATKRAPVRAPRKKGFPVTPASPDTDAQPQQEGNAEVTATEAPSDATKYNVGNVEVTMDQIRAALDILTQSKSMMVRQPLAKEGHPLAACDYHAVAGIEFGLDEGLRKANHPTKTAFVRHLAKLRDSSNKASDTNVQPSSGSDS